MKKRYKLLKELPGVKPGAILDITFQSNTIGWLAVDLTIDGKKLDDYQVNKYCSMLNYMSDEGDSELKTDWFEFIEELQAPIEPIDTLEYNTAVPLRSRVKNLEIVVNRLIKERNERSKAE